jgi:predicted nucleic acid-binding protein
MIIVSDSSPLICFAILGMLDVLNDIIEKIMVPTAVYEEISVPKKPYSEEIKLFLKDRVTPVESKLAVKLLEKEVDPGEAEAIVLAIEKNISDILIDDPKGRKAARTHGLFPVGTIGVLLQAKKQEKIRKIKPLLDRLIRNRIRIGAALYQKALEIAGES